MHHRFGGLEVYTSVYAVSVITSDSGNVIVYIIITSMNDIMLTSHVRLFISVDYLMMKVIDSVRDHV